MSLFESALGAAGIPFAAAVGGAFLARPTVRGELDRLEGRPGRDGFDAWLEDLTLELGIDHTENPPDRAIPVHDDPPARASSTSPSSCASRRTTSPRSTLTPSAGGFLSYLRQSLRDDPQAAGGDGVDLLTFHRAKGLEWRVVLVTGIEDGLVPIAHAKTTAALEEERRLLYVALSRATRELHCSWSRERTFGGCASRRAPSPFLPAVMEACQSVEKARAFDLDSAKAAIAATRSQLENSSPAPHRRRVAPRQGETNR